MLTLGENNLQRLRWIERWKIIVAEEFASIEAGIQSDDLSWLRPMPDNFRSLSDVLVIIATEVQPPSDPMVIRDVFDIIELAHRHKQIEKLPTLDSIERSVDRAMLLMQVMQHKICTEGKNTNGDGAAILPTDLINHVDANRSVSATKKKMLQLLYPGEKMRVQHYADKFETFGWKLDMPGQRKGTLDLDKMPNPLRQRVTPPKRN